MGAVFSQDGAYRYLLWRVGHPQGRVLGMGMLNPSTADESADDPTISRCRRIAREMRVPGLLVWNLFAFRATDPAVLKQAEDPVGADNDGAIALAASLCDRTVLAWGNHGRHRMRSVEVLDLLGPSQTRLAALGRTGVGEPRHPLYLPGGVRPMRWPVSKRDPCSH